MLLYFLDGEDSEAAPFSFNDLRDLVQDINKELIVVEQKLVFVEFELNVAHTEFLVFTNTTASAALKYVRSFIFNCDLV